MNVLANYFEDFLSLFFPELCPACSKNLFKNEKVICTACVYHLPYTNFINDNQNRVTKQLWGRFPFTQADAFLYFNKGGKVQSMLHELKYNNRPEVGFRLGELYGHHLSQSPNWVKPDLLIPVPLHPKKVKKRGYNQSEFIANGISSATQIPVNSISLRRQSHTETQTKKSRYMRYENMKEAFIVREKTALVNQHILLIDDVITTGGTFEACANAFGDIPGLQISVAALAFAE